LTRASSVHLTNHVRQRAAFGGSLISPPGSWQGEGMVTNLSLAELDQVKKVFKVADNGKKGYINMPRALECLDELGFDPSNDAEELLAATVPGPFKEGRLTLEDLIEVAGAAKDMEEVEGSPVRSPKGLAMDRSHSIDALHLSLQRIKCETSAALPTQPSPLECHHAGWQGVGEAGGAGEEEDLRVEGTKGVKECAGGEGVQGMRASSPSNQGKKALFKALAPDPSPSLQDLPKRRASISAPQVSAAGGERLSGEPEDRHTNPVRRWQSLPASSGIMTGILSCSRPHAPSPGPSHGSFGSLSSTLPSHSSLEEETLCSGDTTPGPGATLVAIPALEDPGSPVVAVTNPALEQIPEPPVSPFSSSFSSSPTESPRGSGGFGSMGKEESVLLLETALRQQFFVSGRTSGRPGGGAGVKTRGR
ncbi:unnamed protein product, partial [Discosporangium mesarthrocarpum]